jgi:hypothetical protein
VTTTLSTTSPWSAGPRNEQGRRCEFIDHCSLVWPVPGKVATAHIEAFHHDGFKLPCRLNSGTPGLGHLRPTSYSPVNPPCDRSQPLCQQRQLTS